MEYSFYFDKYFNYLSTIFVLNLSNQIFFLGSGRIIISGLVNKKIVNFEVLNDSECGPFKSVSSYKHYLIYLTKKILNLFFIYVMFRFLHLNQMY